MSNSPPRHHRLLGSLSNMTCHSIAQEQVGHVAPSPWKYSCLDADSMTKEVCPGVCLVSTSTGRDLL
jgi:hypothetical protein